MRHGASHRRSKGDVVSRRVLIWALVPAAAGASLVAVLERSAEAALAQGRERLLAGDGAGAEAAFRRARLWPPGRGRALAGAQLARAVRGEAPGTALDASTLETLQPIVILEAALARGDVGAARTLAELARRSGDPLGPLYAGAFALDAGDAASARSLASASPVPLSSRGPGRRLEQALGLLETGATSFVRDRSGVLVGSYDASGLFHLDDGMPPELVPAPLLGALEATPPPPGVTGIRVDLDVELSRLAQRALGPQRGSIVLLEPHSGAVLAAVSDARTRRREAAAAFSQRREPASIAKLLTTAAAYRAGVDADAAIRGMDCNGVERYGGEPLWCASPAGRLQGLDQAMAISCNLAFANLALRLGSQRLLEEYRLWGFDADPERLLGAAGRLRPPPRTPRELADLAIGLERSDITPLHAALLAAIVASDGRLPEPRLIRGPSGALGLSDDPVPAAAGRAILDPATLRVLREAMEAVALYGTGAALAPRGFPIAMKTGTAAEWRRGYHVNYVGYAPARSPRFVFGVRITYQPSSWAANRVGREVTRRLLRGLAASRQAAAPLDASSSRTGAGSSSAR